VTLDNGTPVFGDLRAETIARTETALSYNRASVLGYKELGVEQFLAYDGDDDPECAERNGQTFTADEAADIEDHPNGTLVFSPLVEKSYRESRPQPSSVKVDVGSPVINLHMPEVNVPAQKAPIVNVAPAEAPVVHVTTPDVTVNPPVVNVKAPVVNVPAPVVNVTTPEAKAPVINVKATPPDVTVNMVPELRITGMPDRVTKREVKRDKQGRIVETTDVEVDA
jgi:hypothetical protein